jgi:hypothetical protein
MPLILSNNLLSDTSHVFTVSPTISVKPKVIQPAISVFSNIQTNRPYLYDGVSNNTLVRHEINSDLRYKFLDKYLYRNYEDILKRLKVHDNNVKVISTEEMSNNDISNDTKEDLIKKSDFIGRNILTLSKVKKILDKILDKTPNLRYYDLPHNEYYVMKAFAKYVKSKLNKNDF